MSEHDALWHVIVDRRAEWILRRLPLNLKQRIERAIDGLAIDPRPAGCKRMQAVADLYRLRVGDWRIIYAIKDAALIVLVVAIGPRGSVHRDP